MAHLVHARPSGGTLIEVDFLKGFKSQIESYEPRIQALADIFCHDTRVQGYEHPDDALLFLPEYREKARKFFCESVRGPKGQTARNATAHSLGGFLLLEILTDPDLAKEFVDTYNPDGIVLFNPFIGNKHYESLWKRWYSAAFGKNSAVGCTAVEQIIPSCRKIKQEEDMKYLPTHMQGLYLHDVTTMLIERIERQGGLADCARDIPILIIGGEYDPVCDNNKIKSLAKFIGAEYKEFATGHNAFLDSPPAIDLYKRWCNNLAYAVQMHLEKENVVTLRSQFTGDKADEDPAPTPPASPAPLAA